MSHRCRCGWALLVAVGLLLITGCNGGSSAKDQAAGPVVTLTPAASKKLEEIIRDGRAGGQLPGEPLYLRVRVVAGGCEGYLHKLDLDPDVSPEDRTFDVGVKVVIGSGQVQMIHGAEIDYHANEEKAGFSVKNPNFEGEAAKKWLSLLGSEKSK